MLHKKYSNQILEHFHNPKNVGKLHDSTNIGKAGTKKNGEIVELQIKIENNVITDVKFMAYGGVVLIAAMSFVTEWLKGKTKEEAMALTEDNIMQALDVPLTKKHAVLLVIEAVKTTIDYITT